MAIVRWDPFREVAEMQKQMGRLFGEFYRRGDDDLLSRGAWWPPVDVYENERDEVVIKAELPDMSREEIKLVVDNGTLTISGEKKMDADMRDDRCMRIERSYGAFTRSFSLPQTVDTSKVSADYRNGVLTVRLPKREEAKPKQITVTVND